MGYWRKNCFALLMALSARLPDFSMIAFCNESVGDFEFALVVEMGDKLHTSFGSGPSKNRAKNAAANEMMETARIHKWLQDTHAETMCDEFLSES